MQFDAKDKEETATQPGGDVVVDGIRRRFLLFGLIGVVLSGLLGGLVGMVPLAKQLEQMAADNLRQVLRDRERIVAVQLAQITEVARQVASRTKARQTLKAVTAGELDPATGAAIVTPILNDALSSGQSLRGITRLNPKGELFVSVGRQLPIDLRQPWRSPQPRLKGPIMIDRTAHIVIAVAVLDRAGLLAGTDLVLFEAASIVNADGRPWRVGEQGRVFVVSDSGTGEQTFATAAYSEQERALLALASERVGDYSAQDLVAHAMPNGQRYLAAIQSIAGTNWHLLGFASEQELRAPIRSQLISLAALLFLLTIVAAMAIWALMRPLSGRLLLRAEDMERQIADKTHELQRNNAELEQFVYIASHDLQEPVRSIKTLAGMITADEGNTLTQQGQKALDYLNKATGRMSELIHGLLEYGRLGAQRVAKNVNLNETFASICEDLQTGIEQSQGQVLIPDNLPHLKLYSLEIRLLFQNLISNSVKFCPPNRTPRVQVQATQTRPREWQFCVTDNGIGIPKNQQEKIFLIFRRAIQNENVEGTGIGLAHCRKIVEMHRGRIWVEASDELGTTICLTLKEVDEAQV